MNRFTHKSIQNPPYLSTTTQKQIYIYLHIENNSKSKGVFMSNKITIHGDYLEGMDIAYLITGSVAAEKSPEIIRRLKYYGADVHPYMTDPATGFVGPISIEFAAKQDIIYELTKDVEHLDDYDAVLIAPATANTINKFAGGIGDTPPLSMLQGALGGLENSKGEKPILIAPAMHDKLDNSILEENKASLEKRGVTFIDPIYRDGRENIADPYTIAASVCRATSKDPLRGKKIIVATGPTVERVDPLRVLTNIFRGRTGAHIATDAWFRGADVELIYGTHGRLEIPDFLPKIPVTTFNEAYETILNEIDTKKPDAAILMMSATDYILPEQPEKKMSSRDPYAINNLKWDIAPKIIKDVREADLGIYLVTAKLETGTTKERITQIAINRANEGDFELVIGNDLYGMKKGGHTAYIVDKNRIRASPTTNQELSNQLLDILGEEL